MIPVEDVLFMLLGVPSYTCGFEWILGINSLGSVPGETWNFQTRGQLYKTTAVLDGSV